MITYRRTSLFDSPAQTLVNTVNCVGVMGKGLAKEFKDREPKMFGRYKDLCDADQLHPGKLWLWRGTENWILNFPTKVHWKQPSKIEWIEQGLDKFVKSYETLKIREISFPRLGCGNGNLEWSDVKPLMEHYLRAVRIPIYIHDFEKNIGIPEHLEDIADLAAEGIPSGVEFDNFVAGLKTISRLGEGGFVDILTNTSFDASITSDLKLRIASEGKNWEFDEEDLHSFWVALLRGLVTQDRAQWSTGEGGNFVITLLSLLPNTRPVEIQRGESPEIAVELQPWARRTGLTSPATEQLKLKWH